MADKPHLWQGQWMDDTELEKRLARLPEWISECVKQSVDLPTVLSAADHYSKALQGKKGNYAELLKLVEDPRILEEMAVFLERENLEQKIRRELGSRDPFLPTRAQFEDSIFEAWAPLGFLVHIAPSNAVTVAPLSLLEGLLSGNMNFLKTSSSDGTFAQLFIRGLLDCDPTHQLKNFVVVARFSSSNQAWLDRLFLVADGIAVWGGEEAVTSVKKIAPSSARIIEWGHKISFIYLTEEQAHVERTLEQAAIECCLFEQQACSSPQCIYVDTGDWAKLESFGERFSKVLDRVSRGMPRLEPGPGEQAEITQVTELERQEACFGKARVIESPRKEWRILIDPRSPLAASPLFRTIWIKPLPRASIIETLRPMRHYLQTVGLSCALKDLAELSDSLFKAGAVRVRRIGEMAGSYNGEAHDGVYALQRYCKRISLQASAETTGISDLSGLRKLEAPSWEPAKAPSILTKAEFQQQGIESDSRIARLFFKSGGSTGEPKMSVFTYEDYHEQMLIGANGLYAAGLDPLTDRNMNLFFSGSLYGGFLSIFSVLERMKAIQFPMAAQLDFPMVADSIIKNKVNVLLGMPSYIIQLFEKCSEALGKCKGVEKIFYGGEHFNDVQLRYLRETFGVKIIKSVGYGSVDTGPLAFQCTHCDGGTHHLHQRLQYLEIVDLEEDKPADPGAIGRLIFTSRMRKGQRLDRYELGDVGHWEEGPCPCGRASPRFKLLGRSGDIFRIGSSFLNYQKFVQILSESLNYAGPVQLILSHEGLQEKITIRVTDLDSDQGRKALLSNYDDLNEIVVVEKMLELEVIAISPESIERIRGSGKQIRIKDTRNRG